MIDYIDNLIDQGIDVTSQMETKKGKNRNAKDIPF